MAKQLEMFPQLVKPREQYLSELLAYRAKLIAQIKTSFGANYTDKLEIAKLRALLAVTNKILKVQFGV